MTSTNAIFAQPEANSTVSHMIPEGQSVHLNFGPEDISGLQLSDAGALIISFENGGQLVFSNFQELINENSAVYLADNTLIDPSSLTGVLQSPDVLYSNVIENSDVVKISQPTENTVQEVTLSEGQKYICDFNPANAAHVEIKDGQMILTFVDGSQVILSGYSEVMAGELPPELTLADGSVLDAEGLLTNVLDLNDLENNVANIEPAAGDRADTDAIGEEDMAALAAQLAEVQPASGGDSGSGGNSGYGFNSEAVEVSFNSPDAVGELEATALSYNAPSQKLEVFFLAQDDIPVISPTTVLLDETNLSGGGLFAVGKLAVNYGNDTPGSISISGQTAITGSLANGTLSSGGIPVIFTQTDIGFVGKVNGNTVFTFTIDSDGTFKYTQSAPFDHRDSDDPNDTLFITFGVIATDADGDKTSSAVRIAIADDGPEIFENVSDIVDESDFATSALIQVGQFIGNVGSDSVVDAYSANDIFNASGSLPAAGLTAGGIAIVVELIDNVYVGKAGTDIIFTLTLDPNTGGYTYEQYAAIDHGNPNDPNDLIVLEFGVAVVDYDGDTADGIITINVYDAGPSLGSATQDTSITTTGTITLPGGETIVDTNLTPDGITLDAPITSNGVPVIITLVDDTYVGTLTTPNGDAVTVIEIQVNDDGTFTQTQYEPIDQGDTTNPVIISIDVEVTDENGTVTTQPVIVSVENNFPALGVNANLVAENNVDSAVVSVSSFIDFGGDGPGAATPTGDFTYAGSVENWNLTSHGDDILVELVGDTYIGTTNGGTNEVFRLEIDPETGDYIFTLSDSLDHADGENPDDLIELQFGMYVTDSEGDGVTGFISIFVQDDAPVIYDSTKTLNEENLSSGPVTETGSLDANFNADGANAVLPNGNFEASGSLSNATLSHNGVAVIVSQTENGYVGTAGTLTVFELVLDPATGTYSFTQYEGLDHADNNTIDTITLTFGAEITDFDGDSDTSIITINIIDSAPKLYPNGPSADHGIVNAEESDLLTGPIVETGSVEVELGGDGPALYAGNTDNLPQMLVSQGSAVVVTFNPSTNTYTGATSTATVFTLSIDPATGAYTYTQLLPIDHITSGDGVDSLSFEFGITVFDSEGEADFGTITINVQDDQPDAQNDTIILGEGNTATGNVIDNDDVGADALDVVVNVSGPNGLVEIPATGTVDVIGNFGTLTIAADGTYSYVTNTNDPDGEDSFTYLVRDNDGDLDEAILKISVTPDFDPIVTNSTETTNETDVGSGAVATGTIAVDYQGEGPGTVTDNGTFSFTGNTSLTSGGQPIMVTSTNAGGYVGMVGSNVIFTLDITDSGEYEFNLYAGVDHPEDGLINLEFGFTATDIDGDGTDGTIIISVRDDVPTAVNDNDALSRNDLIATGNVLGNDEVGADGGASVITAGTFTGAYGVLVISANGAYTYTRTGDAGGVDEFTYTMRDSDGDTSTTTIKFDVDENHTPIVTNSESRIDETDIGTTVGSEGPLAVVSGKVNVDYQGDGAGGVEQNGTLSFNGTTALTSSGQPIIVTPTSSGGYVGKVGAEVIFFLNITNSGDYQFNLYGAVDHPNSNNPDDAINLRFGVIASDSDGETSEGIIYIRLEDDGPVALDDDDALSRTDQTATGNVLGNDEVGADGGASVITTGTFTGTYGVLVISANGAYTYTRTGDAGGVDAFAYEMRDADGDRSSATITFNVADNNSPIITNVTNSFDESNLDTPNYPNLFGSVDINYQGEGPGSLTGNGDFSVNGVTNLTSNGVPVTVTLTPKGYYLGEANGETVFYVEISSDGHYSFTLSKPLDHPNSSNPNDVISLQFGVTATDVDGDGTDGLITINVNDDGPTIANKAQGSNESSLDNGPIVINNTLTHDFGNDGKGSIEPNGTVMTLFKVGGENQTLTAGGHPVVITQTSNGYVGVANGQTIFSLSVNASTGSYTYKQFDNIDHPGVGKTGADDVVWIKMGVTITDADGDTADAIIQIDIRDDGPVSTNDSNSLSRFAQTATGNILANDDLGTDGGSIVHIFWDGGDVRDAGFKRPDGSFEVRGSYGTLVVKTDGSYTYTRKSDFGGVDSFGYSIKDADGDYASAHLVVTIANDHSPISITGVGATDDTNVDGASKDIETGKIDVNYQGDGAGSTTANGSFASSGNQAGALSSNGNNINVTLEGNTYIGTAGGKTIFTMTINANGTYRFEQYDALDHSNKNSHNEALFLKFGVRATDADGDAGNGVVTITVRDDGPEILDSGILLDETNGLSWVKGSVDFDTGADGGTLSIAPASTTFMNANGWPINIGLSVIGTSNPNLYKGVDANGVTFFTLSINPSTGDYTYTQVKPLDHPDFTDNNDLIIINFSTTVTDGDGDKAHGDLIICVHDDGPFARNDSNGLTGTQNSNTGNVTWNDDFGTDGGSISGVFWDGGDVRAAAIKRPDGSFEVSGNNGTLILRADGSYTYTRNGPTSQGVDKFVYTLKDGDGDTVSANLSINVTATAIDARDDYYKLFEVDPLEWQNNRGDTVLNGVGSRAGQKLTLINGAEVWQDTNNDNLGYWYKLPVLANDVFGGNLNTVSITDVKFAGGDNRYNEVKVSPDGDHILIRVGQDFNANNAVIKLEYTLTSTNGSSDKAYVNINISDYNSPLVLDLDGDGVELLNKDAGVTFDMDNDGQAESTGWVSGDDGFLALDKNKDGIINDKSELFGDSENAIDGFDNLSAYDTNQDGVIDANDDVFSDLVVWQDHNSDGVTNDGELLTLAQINIVSISLRADVPEDLYIEGSWISHVSTYLTSDGVEHEIVDAWFDTSEVIETSDVLFDAINDASEIMANTENKTAVDMSILLEMPDDVTESIQEFVYSNDVNDVIQTVSLVSEQTEAASINILKPESLPVSTDADAII